MKKLEEENEELKDDLKKLEEENEQLKKRVYDSKVSKDYLKKLEEENEQLKKRVYDSKVSKDYLKKLEEENEQLKKRASDSKENKQVSKKLKEEKKVEICKRNSNLESIKEEKNGLRGDVDKGVERDVSEKKTILNAHGSGITNMSNPEEDKVKSQGELLKLQNAVNNYQVAIIFLSCAFALFIRVIEFPTLDYEPSFT
eukprot:CAMPEP_0184503418 /NCGR_PEP_ID=MMETSP0113_2-20130426/51881_1 /TAXON_ID=91329 /ORGANISM="Norrisiella sphaerica, Strain BC52" /LENGTH=198 /DNA_ID=CAMNT_0026892913 /DNA_START=149 /DNA_END=745 /DNA_ORIENTATION=+